MAGGCRSRLTAARLNVGAGAPINVAMACSNCARWRFCTSTWVSVLSSNACCCATSRPVPAPRSWRALTKPSALRCSAIDRSSTSSDASSVTRLNQSDASSALTTSRVLARSAADCSAEALAPSTLRDTRPARSTS